MIDFLSLEVIKLFSHIKYLDDVGVNTIIRWETFSLQICGPSEKFGFYRCLSKTLISSEIHKLHINMNNSTLCQGCQYDY